MLRPNISAERVSPGRRNKPRDGPAARQADDAQGGGEDRGGDEQRRRRFADLRQCERRIDVVQAASSAAPLVSVSQFSAAATRFGVSK